MAFRIRFENWKEPMNGKIPILVVITLAISGPAIADNCSREAAERARLYYNDGAARYRLGDLTQAAELFKKSYEACQSSKLLYNIGQTYRLAKDNEKALFFYKQYLSAAPEDDEYRADVTNLISQLQAQIAKQSQIQQAPPPGPAPPDEASKTGTATRADLVARSKSKPVYRKGWFWGVIVGGAVVVGGAVALGVGLTHVNYPSTSASNGTFQF
jgi:tetratricopeptide (TPR) repeat protein